MYSPFVDNPTMLCSYQDKSRSFRLVGPERECFDHVEHRMCWGGLRLCGALRKKTLRSWRFQGSRPSSVVVTCCHCLNRHEEAVCIYLLPFLEQPWISGNCESLVILWCNRLKGLKKGRPLRSKDGHGHGSGAFGPSPSCPAFRATSLAKKCSESEIERQLGKWSEWCSLMPILGGQYWSIQLEMVCLWPLWFFELWY